MKMNLVSDGTSERLLRIKGCWLTGEGGLAMVWKKLIGVCLALTAVIGTGQVRAWAREPFGPAAIDAMLQAEWKKQGVVPATPVDDARFLRRIYIDIVGTIPPAQVVTDFLADRSADKRARAVEALLDSPRYAENWTNYWNHVLMNGRVENARFVDRGAFKRWLYDEFDKNVPWNKLVYDLITASGQNSAGGPGARAMVNVKTVAMVDPDTGAKINGATNWILKYQGKPEDLSGSASRIFLGVQIQCAQCHDHKTEKWKQDDFRRFTACFVNSRPKPLVADRMAKDYRVELIDVNRPFTPRGNNPKMLAAAKNAAQYVQAQPAALDGTDFSETTNRRQALAAWMTAPENPWFAEAIVNRTWSHFLGRGFVEPVDDFRPSNPAAMPELMKRLADNLVAHDYDLKHLIKTICASQVYQLSSTASGKPDQGNTLWARYRLKPMGPEETLDAVIAATNLQPVLEKQFGANVDQMKANVQRQFTFLFDIDEEFEQKEFEGTIPQALMLLNGGLTNRGVSPIPGTALSDVLAMPGGDETKIESLYLRTLSRKPAASELTKWVEFVNAPREAVIEPSAMAFQPPIRRNQPQIPRPGQARKAGNGGGFDAFSRLGAGPLARTAGASPRQQAYEDLFWALLNSSEFMFNH
jgi:hypothetical protein